MYRIVRVDQDTYTRVPCGPSDTGKLFDDKRQAIRYGKDLVRYFPDCRFELDEYGPVSQSDWLICTTCNAMSRQKWVLSKAGCPVCRGMRFARNGDPVWWKRLIATIRHTMLK